MSEINSHIDRRRAVVKYFVENDLAGEDGYKMAMKALDYKPQITRETGGKKFNSDIVQQLIADERKKNGYDRNKATRLLEELRDVCETKEDRTNRLGCIKELNRIHDLYGDENNAIKITQVIVSPQERRQILAKEIQLLDDIDDAPLAIAE